MINPRVECGTADTLAAGGEWSAVVLHISRSEIESGNVASCLERLHVLTDTVENVRKYRDSMDFWVDGYDHDPRELCEIPEVRTFFAQLASEWPHFLWFLVRGSGAIGRLLTLLCHVEVRRDNKTGLVGIEVVNPRQLSIVMMDLFDRGNFLFSAYGLSDAEIATSAQSASEDL